MSRVYVMSQPTAKIAEKIPSSLKIVKKPLDQDGKPSLWPVGITDGKNHGWFEENFILFWGSNDEEKILKELAKVGFRVVDMF